MSVKTLLTALALGIGAVSAAIAVASLLHSLTELSAGGPHMFMHSLEEWVATVGYHTALIVLAAASVTYLARKL